MLSLGELLSTPTTQLGRASRFLVLQIKLWSHCTRLLRLNRAGQQAAALSYRTIFGLIPLAIVMLIIFRMFPGYSDVGEKVTNFIYDQLQLKSIQYSTGTNTENNTEPDSGEISDENQTENNADVVMLTDYLDKIVADFFGGVNKSSVTLVSVLIVLWASLGLLSTIEKAFNNIWHVVKGRNILQRMINYWAILTLGPILLGVGVYLATQNSTLKSLEQSNAAFVPVLLSYLISLAAFFLLYYVLPNTKVHAPAAIWGAAVAAVVWAFAKWGFRAYVMKFIPYSQVYGVLGLVPLTVFWIYVSWLIVLFGLQLTFTTQHLKTLDADEIAEAKETEEYFIANELTAFNIIREIAHAFEQNQAPVDMSVISSKLNIPPEFTEKILDHFVNSGIIVRTSEPKSGFMPAKDLANIKLSDIADALASAGLAQTPLEQMTQPLQQITQSKRDMLEQYNLKQILTGNIYEPPKTS